VIEDVPPPETPVKELGDGLFIQRTFTPQGELAVRLIPIGQATVTESPTLCEMGHRLARGRLGL
jgi:hypothetical protein